VFEELGLTEAVVLDVDLIGGMRAPEQREWRTELRQQRCWILFELTARAKQSAIIAEDERGIERVVDRLHPTFVILFDERPHPASHRQMEYDQRGGAGAADRAFRFLGEEWREETKEIASHTFHLVRRGRSPQEKRLHEIREYL
jgi:hypothetical protein